METKQPKNCLITRCVTPLRVRYAEVDQQGALHHSRFAVYFEVGRTELLRQNGFDYKAFEQNGMVLVVAKLECRFKSPARYDDELELTTTLARIDRARLEHRFELFRPADSRLIALGSTTLVHVNAQGKLRPIPDIFYPGPDWKQP